MTSSDTTTVVVQGQTRTARLLIDEQSIATRVASLAKAIEQDSSPHDELVLLICLDGAMIFAADLIRLLPRTTRLETVKIKSYAGTQSSGQVSMQVGLPADLGGRHVLIIEDIVDTGRTLSYLVSEVQRQQPASLRTVVLLDKPSARVVPVRADFVGFEVGPRFVVGYGLDIDGRYRNLPYVAEVTLD